VVTLVKLEAAAIVSSTRGALDEAGEDDPDEPAFVELQPVTMETTHMASSRAAIFFILRYPLSFCNKQCASI